MTTLGLLLFSFELFFLLIWEIKVSSLSSSDLKLPGRKISFSNFDNLQPSRLLVEDAITDGKFIKELVIDFNEKEVINDVEVTHTTDMNSFIVGLGTGYKWAWNNKFAIAPYANIARNFSSAVNDRFSAIEFNAGVSIGYRF